eukprot:gene5821-7423_t
MSSAGQSEGHINAHATTKVFVASPDQSSSDVVKVSTKIKGESNKRAVTQRKFACLNLVRENSPRQREANKELSHRVAAVKDKLAATGKDANAADKVHPHPRHDQFNNDVGQWLPDTMTWMSEKHYMLKTKLEKSQATRSGSLEQYSYVLTTEASNHRNFTVSHVHDAVTNCSDAV